MLKRVAECCSSCEQALELDPSNSKIRARLATAQVARGDFDMARDTLRAAEDCTDAAIANAKQQIDEHARTLSAADAALAAGEPARALGQYSALETKAVFDSPALALKMGRCYLELKNYPRVLNTTQQVLRANPRNSDALVLRAEALYRNNTAMVDEAKWTEPLEQGQKLLKEALSFDPDHREAQSLRKRLRSLCSKHVELKRLMDNREFEKARELVDEMITETTDNPVVAARLYCERAKAHVRLKDWAMVIKDVGQSTYRDHELVQPYLYRSQALQNLDRHEDAVKDLEALFSWYREQGVYEKLQEAKFLLRKKKRPDYYELLQVPSVASQMEIKKAYRERAAEWHPDKKGHLDEAAKKNAEAMFKRIGEAYEVLTDATKKDFYDKGYDLEGIEEQLELKKRRTEQQACGGCRPGGGCR
jgi:tetratricopeptide (TPR) repeat protein